MDKVLRDSETQLKGTTLFVICAFQLNNFEPLGHQIQYCLHLYPDGKTHKKKPFLCYHDIMYRIRRMDRRCYWSIFTLWWTWWTVSSVLAPITIRAHCSMWLLTFHGMSALHIYHRCQHIVVIRCSFFSGEETVTLVYCFHVLLCRSDITRLLNNRKLTSVLSQRYPCCVGTCHTYAKKSLLPLIFLCSAIRTVFPHAVGTLQDKNE